MLALTLLLAVAAAADPATASAEAAAGAQPEPVVAGEARIIEEQPAPGAVAPDVDAVVAPVVAPAEASAAPPEAPAVPFVLAGFTPADQPAAGAVVRLGGSGAGFESAVDAVARWRGGVAGVTVGRAGAAGDGVRTLGLVLGYAYARGPYRGEALLGWGRASDARAASGGIERRCGHFRGLQVGLDRAVLGGEGWRATLGAGLWWRSTFGLAGAPASHDEVGVGVRLGGELGL